MKKNGEVTSLEEVRERWYDHFKEILNTPSDFCPGVIDEVPSLSPHLELDDPLMAALRAVKRSRAGGNTGILPELLLHGDPELC